MRVILDERGLSQIRTVFAIAIPLGVVLTFYLIRAWTPRGGCDGGLCALSIIPQLGYTAGMWLLNLLALINAGSESKQAGKSKYTTPIVICVIVMLLPISYFGIAVDIDDFIYILIPIILPPFFYAMFLFVACMIARRGLERWEELSEEELLR